MTTVKINNIEFDITFNLACEIAYESLTDKIFDAHDIFPSDENAMPKSKDVTNVIIACLIANDAPIDSDYVLKKASRQEIQQLTASVIGEMFKWLKIPAIAEKHVPEAPADDAAEEEQSPND